jgi:hypothetical protein
MDRNSPLRSASTFKHHKTPHMTLTLALNLAPQKRYKIPDRINAEKSACVCEKIQSQIGFMSRPSQQIRRAGK